MRTKAEGRVLLVGRHRELMAAGQALADTGGVMIVGDPGVGKTSLARAVVGDLASTENAEILWTVASATGAPIPFGAFAPFVPSVGGSAGHQPDALALLQAFRAALLDRAGGRPLVLAIDDAHRLDGHSATLVSQLVTAGEARLVMTVRAGAGMRAGLRALWKEELVARIDLEPLDREGADEYTAHLLGGGSYVGGEVTEALWRTSRGNPLYLRELVVAGRAGGQIVEVAGMWRLAGDLPLSRRLAELLADRLGLLAEEELAALELLAVAEVLPLRVLTGLAGEGPVGSLQRSGLVTVEWVHGEHQVRAAHPLYLDSVRAGLPTPLASAIGLRLADALAADGRAGGDLMRIVAWRMDAGLIPPPGELLEAALRAAEHHDWSLSGRLARCAVDAGGGTEAALALADALRAQGRYAEALAALDGPGPDGRDAGDWQDGACQDGACRDGACRDGDCRDAGEERLARMAVLRALILFPGLGRPAEADEVLARVAGRLADPGRRSWTAAVRAGLLCFAGHPTEAARQAESLLEGAAPGSRAEGTARAVLAMALAWTGRAEDAVAIIDDPLHATSADAGAWLATGWTSAARAVAYHLSGRVNDAVAVVEPQYRLAVQLENGPAQGASACTLGWFYLAQGRLDLALRRFREAAGVLGSTPTLHTRLEALLGLGEVLAQLTDADGARLAVEETRLPAEDSDDLGARWRMAAAWSAAAGGGVSDALRLLDDAAGAARRLGQAAVELRALHGTVRLGSTAANGRLAELESNGGGPLIELISAHGAALAEADPGESLDRVSETYSSAGLNLYAAEAAAQASRAHGLAGRPRKATASAARAHFLLAAVPDGRTPLALHLALAPPELTRRESEVAHLAARGLASSDIANRLCLSVRTVETHLARAYVKLGIGGRGELAGALAGDSPGSSTPVIGPAAPGRRVAGIRAPDAGGTGSTLQERAG